MIIKLKTGETLQAEDKYIDLNQKLILFYVFEKESDKISKKKLFINLDAIEFIKLEEEN